jgi:peptide/nickel transport system permease protein
LNRIFNELPIVALILMLTESGALLVESLARTNDQQLAGAIIILLTGTIIMLNFLTDVLLAVIDPRIRKGVMGGS